MIYRILWAPEVEEAFDNMLAKADLDERTVLAKASRVINQQLVNDPKHFGESRYEDVRVGFEPPLLVQFQIMEDVRTVIVFHINYINRRT